MNRPSRTTHQSVTGIAQLESVAIRAPGRNACAYGYGSNTCACGCGSNGREGNGCGSGSGSNGRSMVDETTHTQRAASESPPWTACEQLLQGIADSLYEVQQRRESQLQEMQAAAVELAVAAASYLVHAAIDADRYGLQEHLDRIVSQMALDAPVTIALHPDDQELLSRQLEQLPEENRWSDVAVIEDHSIPRGGWELRSSQGTWQSDMSLRLSELRKHWLEELDASQIERRSLENTDSTLRRFPDRRGIA